MRGYNHLIKELSEENTRFRDNERDLQEEIKLLKEVRPMLTSSNDESVVLVLTCSSGGQTARRDVRSGSGWWWGRPSA